MRGIKLLRADDGGGQFRIQVGMMPAGKRAIGVADFRGGAMAVEAERGVVICFSALQAESLGHGSGGFSVIAR